MNSLLKGAALFAGAQAMNTIYFNEEHRQEQALLEAQEAQEDAINTTACQWIQDGAWYDFTKGLTVPSQTYVATGDNTTQMYFSLCVYL